MAAITKDQFITQLRKTKVKKINVAGLEGDVYIRQLSTEEIEQFAQDNKDNKPHVIARGVALGLSDEDGNRLFSSKEVDQLLSLRGNVLDHLLDSITQFNRYSEKDVEEMAKNS